MEAEKAHKCGTQNVQCSTQRGAIRMNYIVMIMFGSPKGSINCAATLCGMNLVAQERNGLLSPAEKASHLWFDGPG